MTPQEQLTDWGYTINTAWTDGDDIDVLHIDGYGMSQYVREDDTDTLTALADPAAHTERETQQNETWEETSQRHQDMLASTEQLDDDPEHDREVTSS